MKIRNPMCKKLLVIAVANEKSWRRNKYFECLKFCVNYLRGKLAENTVRLKKGKATHWFSDTETLRLRDVLPFIYHQKKVTI